MENFDILNCPLEGSHLIEASAGTGKTFAVTGLFVRLVVERYLPVRKILAVTYTVAATEELRARIRSKLQEAQAIIRGNMTDDNFLCSLISRLSREGRNLAGESVRAALRDFDEASIFTIHGFCKRMLQEHSFESGSLFNTELVTDERSLREQVASDFWRKSFYHAYPELVEEVLRQTRGPADFLKLLGRSANRPDIHVLPEIQGVDPSAIRRLADEVRMGIATICEAWTTARNEVVAILSAPYMDQRIYGKKSAGYIDAMEQFTAQPGNTNGVTQVLEKFTQRRISASVKRSGKPSGATLEHSFFALCDMVYEKASALEGLLRQAVIFLKAEFICIYRSEMTSLKLKKNILFFDDLLIRLRDALRSQGGERLARRIGLMYPAALIDEFQDTDPIQYDIFRQIFGSAAEGSTSLIYMIGDPKQAIYSFRGADVFSYLEAAGRADRRFSMQENWRCSPELLEAINTIFGTPDNTFAFEAIQYRPIRSMRQSREGLFFDGNIDPPLHLWFVPSDKDPDAGGKPAAKGRVRGLIIRSVAAEIGRLLHLGRSGQALIGDRPIGEEDIAVLVRKNDEAMKFRDVLTELGIPAVLQVRENIFDTNEAFHMERMLMACAYPRHEDLIRTVLAQPFFSMTGHSIDALGSNQDDWERYQDAFQAYHQVWMSRGFMCMFRFLLQNQNIRSHLLRFIDGERRLTNVLHLAELIHEAETSRKFSMTGLIKWLAEQRNPKAPRLEEQEIRLERDAKAVRIVTIHKSKGLEYPIVFCPFAWEDSMSMTRDLIYHDEQGRITWDLAGDDSAHAKLAGKELLSENVRLLYVALSRAKHRCYLVWGRFNQAGTSAPAYLFHRMHGEMVDDFLMSGKDRLASKSNEEMLADLQSFANASKGTIALQVMPDVSPERYRFVRTETAGLTCRPFTAQIDRGWKIASFTYLLSREERQTETPDWDAIGEEGTTWSSLEEREVAVKDSGGIVEFPRGARAGLFFHDLLEHIDFRETDRSALAATVNEKLGIHGYAQTWREPILEMLANITQVQLGEGDLRLSKISTAKSLRELSFYYPIREIHSDVLREILMDAGGNAGIPEAIEKLHFSPVRGFMRGFLDLVFRWNGKYYLVDWKSNYLGERIFDYDQKAIAKAMARSFYHLQYHIYIVALDRYLTCRCPGYDYEHHFGGVYYLFLRGIDSRKGLTYGIYWDRPSVSRMKALRKALLLE